MKREKNLRRNLSKSKNGGQDDAIVRVNEGIRPALAVDIYSGVAEQSLRMTKRQAGG